VTNKLIVFAALLCCVCGVLSHSYKVHARPSLSCSCCCQCLTEQRLVAKPALQNPRQTIEFYIVMPDGSLVRAVVRHDLNDRKMVTVVEACARSIKNRGIVKGVRGDCWLVEPDPTTGGKVYKALTWGHLCSTQKPVETSLTSHSCCADICCLVFASAVIVVTRVASRLHSLSGSYRQM
jgi:hypothetical protein